MKNKKNIKNLIYFIANKVEKHNFEYRGYINGSASKLLFLSHFYKNFCKNKSILDSIYNEQSILIKHIENSEIINLTLSYGLVGVLSTLEFSYEALNKPSELEIDKDFCKYLFYEALELIKYDNYDLLTGGLGIINYLIDNKYEFIKDEIDHLILLLEFKQIDGIWKSKKDITNNTYNLGLSHGYIGIILVLIKLYRKKSNNQIETLIRNSIDKTLLFKNSKHIISYFPSIVTFEPRSQSNFTSRLAWCYGDLGIINVLANAAKYFDKSYLNQLLPIIENLVSRTSLSENFVIDASFCHGTSGIAHMINLFINKLGISGLDEYYEYWIYKTIDMFHENKFKSFEMNNHESTYIENFGILNGYCGIGMVLIDFYSKNKIFNWSKPLLV